ncbi:hypothetical protein [Leptothoe spongobia]|uniref:Uncharacterized protein n=1 Tax=Leptothoe spongobia TAU-MAC 1115 TaxID=1967444 RepID=A0A947GQN9_9CYAN|nr:hypothetical protein [Leptothoe spongobia]MBT9317141.1 hypothetical protein [Leptothoe spongobia TAU-MAC 1115]
MENFYRYGVSRQDLNIRAAHSLCRAGWMLEEVNGVLQNGSIRPESFQVIQQQTTTLDQLQRKFGPPPKLSPSTDVKLMQVDTSKTLTIRVMNRGVEEAAAVLTHHGWHFSQIHDVLKPSTKPLENLGFALMHDRPAARVIHHHYSLLTRPQTLHHKRTNSVAKTLFALFWFGGLIFVGVSLMLHML